MPQNITDEWLETLKKWHEDAPDLQTLAKVASNGYKQYLKPRPAASNESVKRAKKVQKESRIGTFPFKKCNKQLIFLIQVPIHY